MYKAGVKRGILIAFDKYSFVIVS